MSMWNCGAHQEETLMCATCVIEGQTAFFLECWRIHSNHSKTVTGVVELADTPEHSSLCTRVGPWGAAFVYDTAYALALIKKTTQHFSVNEHLVTREIRNICMDGRGLVLRRKEKEHPKAYPPRRLGAFTYATRFVATLAGLRVCISVLVTVKKMVVSVATIQYVDL
jgi:hypothetical protein